MIMHRHFFRLIVLLILCTVYCTISNAQVFKKINVTQTGYGQTASSALINAKQELFDTPLAHYLRATQNLPMTL